MDMRWCCLWKIRPKTATVTVLCPKYTEYEPVAMLGSYKLASITCTPKLLVSPESIGGPNTVVWWMSQWCHNETTIGFSRSTFWMICLRRTANDLWSIFILIPTSIVTNGVLLWLKNATNRHPTATANIWRSITSGILRTRRERSSWRPPGEWQRTEIEIDGTLSESWLLCISASFYCVPRWLVRACTSVSAVERQMVSSKFVNTCCIIWYTIYSFGMQKLVLFWKNVGRKRIGDLQCIDPGVSKFSREVTYLLLFECMAWMKGCRGCYSFHIICSISRLK